MLACLKHVKKLPFIIFNNLVQNILKCVTLDRFSSFTHLITFISGGA